MEQIANIVIDFFKRVLKVDDNGERLIEDGSARPPYREDTRTLAAGETWEVFTVFDYFRIVSQSPAGALKIKFGDNGIQTDYSGVGLGLGLRGVYRRLSIYNNSGAPMTLTIATALGQVNDDRLNVSGTVSITGAVTVTSPAALTTVADVAVAATTTTAVLAVNASRKEAFITNLAANNTVIRLGDASTGAARGIEVPIGGTVVVTGQAAISVYNPSASGINIGVAYTQ